MRTQALSANLSPAAPDSAAKSTVSSRTALASVQVKAYPAPVGLPARTAACAETASGVINNSACINIQPKLGLSSKLPACSFCQRGRLLHSTR